MSEKNKTILVRKTYEDLMPLMPTIQKLTAEILDLCEEYTHPGVGLSSAELRICLCHAVSIITVHSLFENPQPQIAVEIGYDISDYVEQIIFKLIDVDNEDLN